MPARSPIRSCGDYADLRTVQTAAYGMSVATSTHAVVAPAQLAFESGTEETRARRHVLSGSRLSTRIIDTFRNARKVSKAEELDFVGVRPLAAVSDRNDGSPNPMDVAVLPNPAMYNHSQVLAINKFVSPESFCETKPLTSRSAVFGARGRRCEGTLTNRAHAGWYIGGGRRRIEPVVMRGFGLRQ